MRQDNKNNRYSAKLETKEYSNVKNSCDSEHLNNNVNSTREIYKATLPALLVCIVMLLYIVAEHFLKTESTNIGNPYIAIAIAHFFVFLLPCAFFAALGNGNINGGLSNYNLRTFSPKMLGFLAASLAMLLFSGMFIKYLGYVLFGNVADTVLVTSGEDMILLIVSSVIIPAVTEEILLRGVVFTEYEKSGVGALGAIIGSSFLFAFIHFDFQNFISYVLSGVILATSLHVTRSLIAPILLHLLNNATCIFADSFLQKVSKESVSSFFVLFMLGVLFLISLFLFFESLEWIYLSKADKIIKNSNTAGNSAVNRLLPANGNILIVLYKVFAAPSFVAAVIIYAVKIIIG